MVLHKPLQEHALRNALSWLISTFCARMGREA
jgi:hypothetical protein